MGFTGYCLMDAVLYIWVYMWWLLDCMVQRITVIKTVIVWLWVSLSRMSLQNEDQRGLNQHIETSHELQKYFTFFCLFLSLSRIECLDFRALFFFLLFIKILVTDNKIALTIQEVKSFIYERFSTIIKWIGCLQKVTKRIWPIISKVSRWLCACLYCRIHISWNFEDGGVILSLYWRYIFLSCLALKGIPFLLFFLLFTSELEDNTQDRYRIPSSLSSQSFRRNEYGSSPPTRGDVANYSRGTHGRWDSRSSGRSDRDSDSQSDWDSGKA